jgi:hypothetical protein
LVHDLMGVPCVAITECTASHPASTTTKIPNATNDRAMNSCAISPDRHQQTIDVGRHTAAARCPTERRTGGWRSSRTPHRRRLRLEPSSPACTVTYVGTGANHVKKNLAL